jgi:hypothetical protein
MWRVGVCIAYILDVLNVFSQLIYFLTQPTLNIPLSNHPTLMVWMRLAPLAKGFNV